MATGAALTVSPPGALDTVQFINSPPLRLGLIAFSYDFGTPPTTRTPSTTEMGMIISWLGRAYPVAEVQAFQRVVTANAAAPFTCGDINSQLAAIRALDVSGGVDGRTHYYGVVSDSGFFLRGCAGVPSSPDPGAVGSGPTGPGTWGWDFDGCYGDWYAGHEIGHTFGRKHPGFCGESNDDAQYPFDNGQLSDADGVYAGLDVGDATFGLPLTALPGTVWHDVMTYCNRQWLSSYTYLGIRQRLVDEDALSFGAGAGAGRPDERFPEDSAARSVQPPQRRALISIVAEINLARNAGRISYVNPVERGPLSAEDAGSPAVLVFKSADGRSLGKFRSPMQIFATEATDEDRHALCNVIVAPDPSTSIIELYVHDRLADTFKPDPTLPALEPIGLKVEQDSVVVSYGQTAALGAGHSYSVQISDDFQDDPGKQSVSG